MNDLRITGYLLLGDFIMRVKEDQGGIFYNFEGFERCYGPPG